MVIGNKVFDLENDVYIMGILNVTPDSFSDGGRLYEKEGFSLDMALKKVEQLISEGASIIDIGGESTRPGYKKIFDQEEIDRVCPVIEAVKKEFDIAVSVDTYKSQVAKAAVDAGADLINDIWGFKADENVARIAAAKNIPCCIMHNRDITLEPYGDFMADVLDDLQESIEIGLKYGLGKDKLITDPGVGFGKTLENNLEIMANVDRLKLLGCPILLGTSRKSMIGLTLDLPVDKREEGTMATTAVGVMKGCSIIRVHDVEKNYRAAKMALAMRKALRVYE